MRDLGSFHPLAVSEAFIRDFGPFATAASLTHKYDAQLGIWRPLAHSELLKDVQAMSGRHYFRTATDQYGDETTHYLYLSPKQTSDIAKCVLQTRFPLDADFEANPGRGIAFRNGYLEVGPHNLHQITLKPNHPKNYASVSLPFDYDPAAECPKFVAMLDALFAKDPESDREHKKLALAQFYGAALFCYAPKFERCLILEGGGSNGKSTFMEIMQDSLFPKTARAISPQKWDHEYYVASLQGARLNTVGEIPSSEVFSGERFKLIITGDEQTGRHPGERPFQFRPAAAHVFSANELPATNDVTEGFWRRFLVIRFTQHFTTRGGGRASIKDPILTEAPGILNWAVRGLVSLLQQGHYTIPESHVQVMSEWKKGADVVLDFAESCCDESSEPESVAVLYESYKEWALATGHRIMSSVTFGRRLTSIGFRKYKRSANTHYGLKVRERRFWVDVRGGGDMALGLVRTE